MKMTGERKSESGQVATLTAAAMALIIGFAALVIDVGFLYATRRNMQTAADAAAIAGANALNSGDTLTTAKSAARDVAKLNGYADDTNNVTVSVETPASVPSPTNGTYVEVDVAQPVPTYFMRLFGFDTVDVGAKAVAGYGTAPGCMYSLDPNDDRQTFEVSGGTSTVTSNCGILVASSNSDGLDISGGATVDVASIGLVAGGYTGTSGGSSVSPTPVTGVAAVANPFASLSPPSVGPVPASCTTNPSTTSEQGYSLNSGSATIGPGTYCGGITVSGNGVTLNLNAGLYILYGGGLTVQGGANLIGTNVTFYNTGTSSGNTQYKGINVSGGSTTDLTAATTGALAGILFFQDPSAPNPMSQKNNISGQSGAIFTGVLYFPTSPLYFSGGSTVTPEDATLVAWQINISGGTDLSSGGGPGQPPPITTSRLYE